MLRFEPPPFMQMCPGRRSVDLQDACGEHLKLRYVRLPSTLKAVLSAKSRDDWRFLEVNSQPMFARFDQASDGQLTDALLDFLVGSS